LDISFSLRDVRYTTHYAIPDDRLPNKGVGLKLSCGDFSKLFGTGACLGIFTVTINALVY